MGEIAEQLYTGAICSECMQPFEDEPPGHERVCLKCSQHGRPAADKGVYRQFIDFLKARPKNKWVMLSQWHYRYNLPDGERFDFWPTKTKWRVYGKTHTGKSLKDIGAGLKRALERATKRAGRNRNVGGKA